MKHAIAVITQATIAIGLFIVLLTSDQAHSGFRFGLANAMTRRAANVIENDPEAIFTLLPSCGDGALFDHLPLALDSMGMIAPLGNLNPTGHTFPTDHLYMYLGTTSTYSSSRVSIYSPGNVLITEINSTEYIGLSYTDYGITFYPCKELKINFGHVSSLSSAISLGLGSISQGGSCESYSTGGLNVNRCEKNVAIWINSGDPMGTAGGRPSQALQANRVMEIIETSTSSSVQALDVTATDYRISAHVFANSGKQSNSDHFYNVCPIDYFSSALKSQLEGRLGLIPYLRTETPLCGTIAQDVPGTAQGLWYYPGGATYLDDQHLALVHHNVFASSGAFSIGNTMSTISSGVLLFNPVSSGLINRDFDEVTADGNVYCYENLIQAGSYASAGKTIILQMSDSTNLKIEKGQDVTCGAGPWTFTSSYTAYER